VWGGEGGVGNVEGRAESREERCGEERGGVGKVKNIFCLILSFPRGLTNVVTFV